MKYYERFEVGVVVCLDLIIRRAAAAPCVRDGVDVLRQQTASA